jgi:hypothetical protein
MSDLTPTEVPQESLAALPAGLEWTTRLDWVGGELEDQLADRYPELHFLLEPTRRGNENCLVLTGPLPVIFRFLLNEYDAAEAEQLWNELARRDWLQAEGSE